MNKHRIIKKLQTKGGIKSCPICGKKEFYVENFVSTLEVYNMDKLYPVIIIICKNCSNLMMFSAIRLGELDKYGKEIF